MRTLCLAVLATALTAADPLAITIHPDRPLQVIKGLGFEIQSDSIGSGNHGMPEEPIAVPHDLVPSERDRLATEMLKGFRYCRLAGGLYWRGLDAEQKRMQPRWPEQLQELKHLLDTAGVEGLSFEYWSPAPYWKSSRAYIRGSLRCFDEQFANDPDYHGDTERFLKDFAAAVADDVRTLRQAGLRVCMFGLQNEPHASNGIYSTCKYPTPEAYVQAFVPVATAVRNLDPSIQIFADSSEGFPKFIAPGMDRPEVARLVDAYAVHIIGHPADEVPEVHARIREKLPSRPWFQNEYEYITGGATRERCLNTVQHIQNCFQLAGNPTWFWIHALKPMGNAEASGYSMGFWKTSLATAQPSAKEYRRWTGGPAFTAMPEDLRQMESVTATYAGTKPGIGYSVEVNQPVTAYLVSTTTPDGWTPTSMSVTWSEGTDVVNTREYPAGKIVIPKVTAGPPHVLFLKPSTTRPLRVDIGGSTPIAIRSEAIALEQRMAAFPPGHWVTNPYNWNAVGSFVRHIPWDSTVLSTDEGAYQGVVRHLAIRRPDGRMVVVISNRSPEPQPVSIATMRDGASWTGWRYTPDEGGADTRGTRQDSINGATLDRTLPGLSWEFWEEN